MGGRGRGGLTTNLSGRKGRDNKIKAFVVNI